MPGTPHNPTRLFDEAIAAGELTTAWETATKMVHVSLDRALRLVMLMARDESPGLEKAARRFIVRFIREVDPTLTQIMKVADAINSLVGKGLTSQDATDALTNLAEQLGRRRYSTPDWPPDLPL